MKQEAYRYVLAYSANEAARIATYGAVETSRKKAWDDWLRYAHHDKAHYQKRGLRSWRVKVTAEVTI